MDTIGNSQTSGDKAHALSKMLSRIRPKESADKRREKDILVKRPVPLKRGKAVRDPKIFAEEEDLEMSFIEKIFAKRRVRITLFIAIVVYGLFQVAMLWLWVADALGKEKALVFGPPSGDIVTALLVVAALGSLTFGCEIVSAVYQHVTGKQLLSEDITEVTTMCVEEIPTVTLSALLAACWEVPLSLFQLIKACGAIFGAIFRSIRVLKRYVEARRSREPPVRPRLAWIIRTSILAACVYCLVGSILVWVFTFQNPDGSFRRPNSIKESEYDHGRYFNGAGLYLTHPALEGCGGSSTLSVLGRHGSQWIKVAGIYEMQASRQCWFELFYSDARVVTHTRIEFLNGRHESWFDYTNCTAVNLHSVLEQYANLTLPWNDTLASLETESFFEQSLVSANDTWEKIKDRATFEDIPAEVRKQLDQFPQRFLGVLRFSFQGTASSKVRVFGDVTYRAALVQDGVSNQFLETDDWGFLRTPCSELPVARFQYFKVRRNVTDTSTFCEEGSKPTYRAYVHGKDVRNVTEVWKTGYRECAMTGSLRPNPDKVDLACHSRPEY